MHVSLWLLFYTIVSVFSIGKLHKYALTTIYILERRMIMSPISEAKKRANAKYNAKAYDRLEVKVHKGQKEIIVEHAKAHGESLNAFINRAIREAMERDNQDK